MGSQPVFGQVEASADSITYTVKPGDSLMKIAIHHGSPNFRESIYEVNRARIEDPGEIETGQKLIIPPEVVQSEKFTGDRDSNPSRKEKEKEKSNHKNLEAFRRAFDHTVHQEKSTEEEVQPERSGNGLEIGGLIINETRSKLGKDFFNTFYQFWDAPENAPNFLLTISERPIPGMGTMITINLDRQPIYQSKLQPRNTVIEQQARQAVAIGNRTLQQQIQTTSNITIY